MSTKVESEPKLVFEVNGKLLPHRMNSNVHESDLTTELYPSNLFLPKNASPYKLTDFEEVSSLPTTHMEIITQMMGALFDVVSEVRNQRPQYTDLGYIAEIVSASELDASVVADQTFASNNTRHATILFTPYFPQADAQLHTRVYLSSADLEKYGRK